MHQREKPFGERHKNRSNCVEFLTADGLCVLEVFQTNREAVTEDVLELKFAAGLMLRRCVRDGGGQGAIAVGLGAMSQPKP